MAAFSTDERQLLDDSLQAYFSGNYGFERWKQLRAMPGAGCRDKEWSDYAKLGWLGVALPEDAGGTGGGATELGILMAAAGRHIALEPLLGAIVLGARAIEVANKCFEKGVLVRSAGDAIVLSPPLIIETGEIDRLFTTVADAVRQTP